MVGELILPCWFSVFKRSRLPMLSQIRLDCFTLDWSPGSGGCGGWDPFFPLWFFSPLFFYIFFPFFYVCVSLNTTEQQCLKTQHAVCQFCKLHNCVFADREPHLPINVHRGRRWPDPCKQGECKSGRLYPFFKCLYSNWITLLFL